MAVHAEHVAEAILRRLGPLDTMKLQKLTYMAHGFHLAWIGTPLVDEEFQAFAEGPVSYRLFKKHQGQFKTGKIAGGDPDAVPDTAEPIIEFVCAYLGELTGQKLSAITHEDGPWVMIRGIHGHAEGEAGTAPIPNSLVKQYFGQLEESEQAWYWLPDWQRGEAQAEAEIAEGQTETFESEDDFLSSLG